MTDLRAVYAEKSDGELLDLFAKREGLTEKAQGALAEVMRERGLGGAGDAGGETVDGDSGVADAPSRGVSVGAEEGLIYLFHDAFEAREAIWHMREADIAHRMLDWHEVEPERAVSSTGLDLGLVVRRVDGERAVRVLKETMGLFPGPERIANDGHAEGMTVLSMFEREEGLVAARALGEAGITYLWRDGMDDTAGLPDEETVAIEVRAEDLERAERVVEG